MFPFGLNTSLWAFTQFVKATTNQLITLGIWCLAYMDDIIVMALSKVEALQAQEKMLSLLTDLGWLVNWEKSSLKPSQAKEFLGLMVDTLGEPHFQVPVAKSHTL